MELASSLEITPDMVLFVYFFFSIVISLCLPQKSFLYNLFFIFTLLVLFLIPYFIAFEFIDARVGLCHISWILIWRLSDIWIINRDYFLEQSFFIRFGHLFFSGLWPVQLRKPLLFAELSKNESSFSFLREIDVFFLNSIIFNFLGMAFCYFLSFPSQVISSYIEALILGADKILRNVDIDILLPKYGCTDNVSNNEVIKLYYLNLTTNYGSQTDVVLSTNFCYYFCFQLLAGGLFIYFFTQLFGQINRFIFVIVGKCDLPSTMNEPLLRSRTLKEFWGSRYSQAINLLLKESVYKPLRRSFQFHPAICLLLAFSVSGFLHAYPMVVGFWPLSHKTALIHGFFTFSYFIIQGFLLLIQSYIFSFNGLNNTTTDSGVDPSLMNNEGHSKDFLVTTSDISQENTFAAHILYCTTVILVLGTNPLTITSILQMLQVSNISENLLFSSRFWYCQMIFSTWVTVLVFLPLRCFYLQIKCKFTKIKLH